MHTHRHNPATNEWTYSLASTGYGTGAQPAMYMNGGVTAPSMMGTMPGYPATQPMQMMPTGAMQMAPMAGVTSAYPTFPQSLPMQQQPMMLQMQNPHGGPPMFMPAAAPFAGQQLIQQPNPQQQMMMMHGANPQQQQLMLQQQQQQAQMQMHGQQQQHPGVNYLNNHPLMAGAGLLAGGALLGAAALNSMDASGHHTPGAPSNTGQGPGGMPVVQGQQHGQAWLMPGVGAAGAGAQQAWMIPPGGGGGGGGGGLPGGSTPSASAVKEALGNRLGKKDGKNKGGGGGGGGGGKGNKQKGGGGGGGDGAGGESNGGMVGIVPGLVPNQAAGQPPSPEEPVGLWERYYDGDGGKFWRNTVTGDRLAYDPYL